MLSKGYESPTGIIYRMFGVSAGALNKFLKIKIYMVYKEKIMKVSSDCYS